MSTDPGRADIFINFIKKKVFEILNLFGSFAKLDGDDVVWICGCSVRSGSVIGSVDCWVAITLYIILIGNYIDRSEIMSE